jgi:ABC-type multidrug transport system fused ATPase/permease subunit
VTGASLRRLFSVVTQDAQLFNGTIRENIAYGRTGADDSAIKEAARRAELGLGEEGSDLSLDKPCGEKGAKLSGGQQQRIALARAMLKNGTIYLLDEPTTGLDGMVAKQIQQTLDGLSENVTTIMITHHLEDLKHAHSILYLDSGKIVESGTYEALLASGGKFAEQVEARKRGGT